MKDIYELIRQKEAEIERIQRELEALRIAAHLLDDSKDAVARVAAPAISRETPVYGAAPTARPQTPVAPAGTATPTAWASAKQFP